MNWSLIAAGVTAGLGLVIAKQWFERRGEEREREAIFRRRAAESASAPSMHPHDGESPQASVAAADARAAPAAASDTPFAKTEPLAEDRIETEAAVSGAGDTEPTEAELVSGSASDAETAAEPDVETTAKRDTETAAQPDTVVSSGLDTHAPPQGVSDDKRVEEALASDDLSVMETVLQEVGDPIHRNLLLTRLVAGHYRLRAEPGHREAFYRVAHAQIEEASAILNAIEMIGRPRPDHIDAFRSAAIALDEDERYDEAIAICKRALSLGLEDGTKTGFEGRISRLEKRRASDRGSVRW